MSDQKLADGSFPVKIGDNNFFASMLTDRDYADLVGYAQAKYIETAKNATNAGLNGSGSEVLRFAIASAAKIAGGCPECVEIIGTDEGTIRVGYQLLRKRHPRLSFDKYMEIVQKNKNEACNQIVTAYSFLHPQPKEEDVGGSSTENQKSDD